MLDPIDPLVKRIAEAQASARRRAQGLRERLPELARRLAARGATRIVLFGSLATGAEPHAETDVDLAVAGMDDDARAETLLELTTLIGASIDLVAMETASERLRARIEREGIPLEVPRVPR